jgi:flagellar biosynthesis protein FlhF
MLIKRYLVKNMNEAMLRIKYELGSDAVIVSSRRIRQRGIKSLFKPKLLEVTAAVDNRVDMVTSPIDNRVNMATSPEDNRMNMTTAVDNRVNMGTTYKQNPDNSASQPELNTRPLVANNDQGLDSKEKGQAEATQAQSKLELELKELKSLVGQLVDQAAQVSRDEEGKEKEDTNIENEPKSSYQDRLVDYLRTMELDDGIVDRLISSLRESKSPINKLEDAIGYIRPLLPTTIKRQDINSRVWALIGPTGVGKTTTIAKIAAQEILKNNKTVGLITLDTYRIGAVEQLKTYAKILNIPLEVALNKADLIEAMEKLKDRDLILIDTTGRNSLDKDQLLETKDLLDTIEDKGNLLVVNVGTRRSDLKAIIESYNFIGFDSIVLTKLDETRYYGNILNIASYCDKPLSFVTTGQVVPDDILEASKANLIDYLLLGVEG